jgi:uncharacterized membrane protein YccC
VLVAGLSTSGATNQKLIFRFLGSAVGGLICGLGCIVFIFPYVDTATPFLLAIAAVTFLAAWVSRSPHFSYIGLQIAFSFYFVVLSGPSAPTQLAGGRDRLMGILLALLVLMLVFRPEKSVDKMRQTLARLLTMQADYLQAAASQAPAPARRQIAMQLRNRMEPLVASARELADLMTYEFDRQREQHVVTSEKIQTAISHAGDLLLSMNSWPRKTGSAMDDDAARKSRIALENGLRSLAAALAATTKPGEGPEEDAVRSFGQQPFEAPLYVRNSLEIYQALSLKCAEIAACC